MSGHSKFHNIKNVKGKADAARSKIFTKISREISVAVKAGGPDPNTNSKLFDCIQKAKANNMPNDNIQRTIKKANGEIDNVNYESVIYEGYGAGGVAFVVECLTDNRNRTAGEVRHLFDRHGGSLGTNGSVMYMFEQKGVIVIEKKPDGMDYDQAFELAIECGADDVKEEEEVYIFYTSLSEYKNVKDEMVKRNIEIFEANLEYVPSNYIVPEEKNLNSLQTLAEKLEDLDDVQNVYHNGDF